MQVKRLISKRIRKAGSGIDLVADVRAAVSVNVNEHGSAASSTTSTTAPPPDRGAAGLDDRGRENA